MAAKIIICQTKAELKKLSFISLFTLLTGFAFGQSDEDQPMQFWKLTHIDGEVRLRGYYRDETSTTGDTYDHNISMMGSAGVLLRTKSYFWTPKFMKFDFDAEFNPETSTDHYIVVPDQAEVRTVSRINAAASFFEQKPVNLVVFGNLDNCYSNRENLTNLKSFNKGWGSSLNWFNRVLPATVQYKKNWNEIGRAHV